MLVVGEDLLEKGEHCNAEREGVDAFMVHGQLIETCDSQPTVIVPRNADSGVVLFCCCF